MTITQMLKTTAALLIIAMSACQAQAQTPIFIPKYLTPLLQGGYTSFYDYDNDGDPDLLISGGVNPTYSATSTTRLFRNDNGTFVPQDETFGGYTGPIFWTDNDHDGKIDLVLLGSATFHLDDGKFTHVIAPDVLSGSFARRIADVDNDGLQDVVTVSDDGFGRLVRYWHNTGPNGFTLGAELVDGAALGASAADFNSDGLVDMLTATNSEINIWWNRGNGFEKDITNTFPSILYPYCDQIDFDNDGDLDIILRSASDKPDVYYYQNDAGIFTLVAVPFLDSAHIVRPYGNDREELIISKNDVNGIQRFYHRSSTGEFAKMDLPPLPNLSLSDLKQASDPTDPGSSFLVISGYVPKNQASVTKLFHRVNGEWQELFHDPLLGFQTDSNIASVQWFDYNHDGKPDIFLSPNNATPGRVLQSSDNDFIPVAAIPNPERSTQKWVDFDNDGKKELIAHVGQAIVLYSDPVSGVYKTLYSSQKLYNADFQLVDFDGDGDNDLLMKSTDQLLENKNNVFSPYILAPGSDFIVDMPVDFDLDGKMDFLGGNLFISQQPMIVRNTGTGFVAGPLLPTSMSRSAACWLDYDGDSYPDLLVCFSESNPIVKLFRNQDGKSFGEVPFPVVLSHIDDVRAIDVNEDGYPDLFMTGRNHNPILLLNNKGTFALATNTGLLPGNSMHSDFADIDRDGDQDLLLTDDYRNIIYLNQSVNASFPVITSVAPASNTVIPNFAGVVLTIQFNEPIQANVGNIKLVDKGTNEVLYQVGITDPSISLNGHTMKITLPSTPDFLRGKSIAVLLDANLLQDAKGSLFAGESDPSFWILLSPPKTPQTISFSTAASVSLDTKFISLQATATSGLSVTFESSDSPTAEVSGTQLILHKAGIVKITATQSGSDVYDSATRVSQIITITPSTVTGLNDEHVHSSLYPNPSDDMVWLKVGSEFEPSANITVDLLDIHGALIRSVTASASVPILVATSNDSAGMFIVKVFQSNRSENLKLILVH